MCSTLANNTSGLSTPYIFKKAQIQNVRHIYNKPIKSIHTINNNHLIIYKKVKRMVNYTKLYNHFFKKP